MVWVNEEEDKTTLRTLRQEEGNIVQNPLRKWADIVG